MFYILIENRMIEKLQIIYNDLISKVDFDFKRDFYEEFDLEKMWATAIIWEIWIWKTYFMLQKLKESKQKTMYFSFMSKKNMRDNKLPKIKVKKNKL